MPAWGFRAYDGLDSTPFKSLAHRNENISHVYQMERSTYSTDIDTSVASFERPDTQ